MTVSVNITGLESIAQSINNLAVAISGKNMEVSLNGGVQSKLEMPQIENRGLPQSPVQTVQQPYMPVLRSSVLPQSTQQSQLSNFAQNKQQGSILPTNLPVQQPAISSYQTNTNLLPTTATTQNYTQDQIAIAMTGLMDQGKGAILMAILQQFGAQSLMQIPKDRYSDIATKLREAGANI